ncbi:MAG: hypothetical protein KJZ93_06935 [Caldilineaceae bacterium]|nr:hypothetical protein [Caldilineaceae bacterium]
MTLKRILFWAPRALGILFALFVSLFALDVFGVGYSFWETILALLIHLVPVYLILIALAIGWRWERVGSVLFVALGALYMITAWGQFAWGVYLVIAGPAFLIGILFLVDWFYRTEMRPAV